MDEVDPARVAEATAIIDSVAALRPDEDYETNSLTWAVAAYAVGLTDVIGEARAERDRLRAVVEDPDGALEAMHGRLDEAQREQAQLVAERDRLRAVVEALREWRDAQKRLTMADIAADISDARDDAEVARQTAWLALARWEEQLDVSENIGAESEPDGG